MVKGGRRKAKAFFGALGASIVAAAVALNIGWILLNWRTGLMLVVGVIFFVVIITGVVLNTIFLIREIRKNEQHDAFINAVTHELKTPVASMRLYLQTLQSRDLDEAKRREFYDIMLSDSDRLTNTIDQVLRAASNASSSKKSWSAPVDLSALVRECVDLARRRHHLPEDAVHYTPSLDSDRANVLGDIDELRAAVSNLLDNAVKYSGQRVSVAVELARTEAGKLAVRVSDDGVGIPHTELKRIFKRFYRIPGNVATRVRGTGLGLFIVRSVAEKHGGKVFAESQGTGHGSTFTIELPAAPPKA